MAIDDAPDAFAEGRGTKVDEEAEWLIGEA